MVNADGNSALHLAAEKSYKDMILLLLMGGSDYLLKNKADERAGDKNPDIKLHINMMTGESKAFNILSNDQKKKLKVIFDDIDRDKTKLIDLNKTRDFNMYIESCDAEIAEKDAKDFVSSCAIANKNAVNIINSLEH